MSAGCGCWLGWRGRTCDRIDGTRRYLNGLRCPDHKPGTAPDLPGSPANLLTDALEAAEAGWSVFPLYPGSKVPALHGVKTCPRTGICTDRHQGFEQRATRDPDRIAACWSAGRYNVGIATGPSGLVVVDLDMPKPGQPISGADTLAALLAQHGETLPDTWTVSTTSGGTHYYFTAPAGVELRNTAKKLGPGIDTRAGGGLVVAPGSVIGGRPYAITRRTGVAPLPGWLADLLTPAPLPMQAPVRVRIATDRQSAWLNAAITRQTDYLSSAKPGERNQALYVSAVALGQLAAGGALSETEVEDLLTQACLSGKFQPKPSTIASGIRAGARRPRRFAS